LEASSDEYFSKVVLPSAIDFNNVRYLNTMSDRQPTDKYKAGDAVPDDAKQLHESGEFRGVPGMWFILFEVDANNKIVKYQEILIKDEDVNLPNWD
jgi:hypothetical protein